MAHMPGSASTLRDRHVLIRGTVHSRKVMRSSWVKWCWKWIISSLFPDGAAGTFLLDLVVWSHPSSTIGQVGASLITGEATRPPAFTLQTKAHDRKPPSNPITTRSSPAAAFLLEILRYCGFYFLVWLLTHLRLKYHQKLLQPRSGYCFTK